MGFFIEAIGVLILDLFHTGPGGGFSTTGKEGAFSSKSGRGRQDY